MDYAAIANAVAARSPHSAGLVPVVANRVLRVDGDGLAYYSAGKDDTPTGEARHRFIDKIRSAVNASGADRVEIVATHPMSHKGHRYAIARRKPYQGNRSHEHRPKNWVYLRELFNEGKVGEYPVVQVMDAEADDLFARNSKEDQVIYTQDKDMRMVPGIHLDWISNVPVTVRPGAWEVIHDDKVYGRKWFWLQVLMGDAVDNIPGLPRYRTFYRAKPPKEHKIGEVTAGKFLSVQAGVRGEVMARKEVVALYKSYYGDRWLVELAEQGMLLWMRTDPVSDPFDVFAEGNPFHPFTSDALYPSARAELEERIAQAEKYGSIETVRIEASTRELSDESGEQVRDLQTAHDVGTDSAGSRPLDRDRESSPSPVLQRDAGQGGEQLQAVRAPEPKRILAWGIWVPATARNTEDRVPSPVLQD